MNHMTLVTASTPERRRIRQTPRVLAVEESIIDGAEKSTADVRYCYADQ